MRPHRRERRLPERNPEPGDVALGVGAIDRLDQRAEAVPDGGALIRGGATATPGPRGGSILAGSLRFQNSPTIGLPFTSSRGWFRWLRISVEGLIPSM
jgi:hypothetical protein